MKTFIIILFCVGVTVSSTILKINERKRRMFLTPTACTDVLPNCADYDPSTCQKTEYKQWATKNCARTCNLCPSATGSVTGNGGTGSIGTMSGTSSTCTDVLPNCADYDPSTCQKTEYKQWATKNCARTCNLCPSATGSATGNGGTGSSGTMSGTSSTCTDVLPNCADYDPSTCQKTEYKQWATKNCARTCNLCPSATGSVTGNSGTGNGGTGNGGITSGASSSCKDVLDNCAAYDPSTCQKTEYKQWATQNCARTCNLCPSTTGPVSGNSGSGNNGTVSGTSYGCVYKSQVYQQGQKWRDGCKYTCHCMDGFSGQYVCNELCLTWDLPSQCGMRPAAPGKCCPTPYCPAGFTINYPPGYTEL